MSYYKRMLEVLENYCMGRLSFAYEVTADEEPHLRHEDSNTLNLGLLPPSLYQQMALSPGPSAIPFSTTASVLLSRQLACYPERLHPAACSTSPAPHAWIEVCLHNPSYLSTAGTPCKTGIRPQSIGTGSRCALLSSVRLR